MKSTMVFFLFILSTKAAWAGNELAAALVQSQKIDIKQCSLYRDFSLAPVAVSCSLPNGETFRRIKIDGKVETQRINDQKVLSQDSIT